MERACDLIRSGTAWRSTSHTIRSTIQSPSTCCAGRRAGVFQVGSAGMRRYLVEMKPRTLAHVTANGRPYRPGPMESSGLHPTHARPGSGPLPPSSPAVDPGRTYGITVYSSRSCTPPCICGYSAAEADNAAQSVAKKKAEALHQERGQVCPGRDHPGRPLATANAIFDDWEAFARYGFPRDTRGLRRHLCGDGLS